MSDLYATHAEIVSAGWCAAVLYSLHAAITVAAEETRVARLSLFVVATYCLLRCLGAVLLATGDVYAAADVERATDVWSMFGAVTVALCLRKYTRRYTDNI